MHVQDQSSLLLFAFVSASKTSAQRLLCNAMRLGKRASVCSLALYLSCTSSLWAFSAFQNLDFEAADVSDMPLNHSELVPVTNGLPGWSAYIGTNQLTQVSHNAITLGDANVGICGPQYSFDIQPLEGKYTAILQPKQALPASIAQTALIPASANSLRFKAVLAYTNDLSVTVGGQSRPVVPLGSGSFGCDISAFAGSVKKIRFTIGTAHGNDLNFLDAITFSPQPIPLKRGQKHDMGIGK